MRYFKPLMLSFAALLLTTTLAIGQTAAKKKTKKTKKVKTELSTAVKAEVKTEVKATTIVGMPIFEFNTKTTDFGTINTGDTPSFTYTFKNTGDTIAEIEIVSACDCTELDYTQTPIGVGESGFVKATFNSSKAEAEDHKKPLEKDVTIIFKNKNPRNGYPLVEILKFNVMIRD